MGGSGLFQMSYKPGTVVDLWYCNPGEKNKAYPYQVRLDEGQLIYAVREKLSKFGLHCLILILINITEHVCM